MALSRFPKIEQDICLRVRSDVAYQELHAAVTEEVNGAKPLHSAATVTPIDIYQPDTNSDHKQVTFRISLVPYDHTLTDSDVGMLFDSLANQAPSVLAATRV